MTDYQLNCIGHQVSEPMREATSADRDGSRVMYGDFIDLMTHTSKAFYSPQQTIFNEGDLPDGFHLLLAGAVEVVQRGAVVATIEAGEYFGETALLSEAPRNATVRALEPVCSPVPPPRRPAWHAVSRIGRVKPCTAWLAGWLMPPTMPRGRDAAAVTRRFRGRLPRHEQVSRHHTRPPLALAGGEVCVHSCSDGVADA